MRWYCYKHILITDVQSPGSQVESRHTPGPFTRGWLYTLGVQWPAYQVRRGIMYYEDRCAGWVSPASGVVSG